MRVVFCLNKDYYCNKIGGSFNFVTLKEHTKVMLFIMTHQNLD